MSHQVIAAAVDKRVGGSIATAAQWNMGDAENAMTAWAKQLATRLSSWTSGTAPSRRRAEAVTRKGKNRGGRSIA